ncbi:hypothetical protein GCM10025868_40070 [Angustibacter aerolatus]|uniref:Uncharacterized protein n=1 Tax=Angustibacter aerolatus TaxID=1162965 RepID=A0ABQ6JPJ2_9ACTN|nr:hypothetical protein GCM10025868_40070 [Angustibacter aerolatus]
MRVETPAGRAEYAAAQRGFAVRGQALRADLLALLAAWCPDARAEAPAGTPQGR